MDYSLHILPIPLEEYELPRWIKLEAKSTPKVASGAGYGVAERNDAEAKSGYVLNQGTPLDAHPAIARTTWKKRISIL